MTHNQHYNIYVSSSVKDGGIIHLCFDGENLVKKSHYSIGNSQYSVISKNKFYTLLREDDYSCNSILSIYNLSQKGEIGKRISNFNTMGNVACHLAVVDENVFVTNYISGSVFKTPDKILNFSGSSINKKRQEAPHAHFVCETPDKKYICVTDLGSDRIYFLDKQLNLVDITKTREGIGPRHLVFSQDGNYLYLICELSSTVEVYSYNDAKLLLLNSYSSVSDDCSVISEAAAIKVKNGYLFASNRGENTIAVFKENGAELEKIGVFDSLGNWPRDIEIVGDFLFIANQYSNNISVLKILDNGSLIPTDFQFEIQSPTCICVDNA